MFKVKLSIQNSLRGFLGWIQKYVWRRQTLYGILLLLFLVLLVYQLSVIPSKFAQEEMTYATETQSYTAIGRNPLSLPHKLASFSISLVTDSARWIRAISIVFFGFCVVALYRILKRWHSDQIALFATVLFATNASALAVARLGTPLVLLFGWSIVISLLLWMQHGNSRKIAPFSLIVISAALLYVPGAPYFFLLLGLLFRQKLVTTIRTLKNSTLAIAIGAALFVLLPLLISFIRDPLVLKEWLLLPDTIAFKSIIVNILRVPSAFIYRTPIEPLLNVGRLPILDVAAGGFFLMGLYAYQKYIKLERTRIMILTALLSIIIGALGEVAIAAVLLMPFVYSVIAAGISFVLDEWYGVFPKNPFARSFGLLLVTFVVLMSIYYQLTRFLVVWPQTPETRAVYNLSGLIQ
jgi:hypothetical protein